MNSIDANKIVPVWLSNRIKSGTCDRKKIPCDSHFRPDTSYEIYWMCFFLFSPRTAVIFLHVILIENEFIFVEKENSQPMNIRLTCVIYECNTLFHSQKRIILINFFFFSIHSSPIHIRTHANRTIERSRKVLLFFWFFVC